MNESPDTNTWEEQIDALLDGELTDEQAMSLKAAAEHDPALARAISDANELRLLISKIPVESTPNGLRRKLRQIPQQHGAVVRAGFPHLRWGMVTATAVIAVTIAVSQMWQEAPTATQITQARQEFDLALSYLAKANCKPSN